MRKPLPRASGILDAEGGCVDCQGSREAGYEDPKWTGKNALASAANHARSSGHTTWAQQIIGVTYNPKGG